MTTGRSHAYAEALLAVARAEGAVDQVGDELFRFARVLETNDDMDRAFGASVPDWPEFADSPGALAFLGEKYRLVILSNVDRVSFAGSNARLEVTFDAIYTAEDIGSYKPDPANFDYLLGHLEAEFDVLADSVLQTRSFSILPDSFLHDAIAHTSK